MTFQDIIMFLTYLYIYIYYHKFYDLRKKN